MANLITSLASTTDSETPAPTSWWLKDPATPSKNKAVEVSSFQLSEEFNAAVYSPVGRSRSVVLRGPHLGDSGTLSLRTTSSTDFAAVQALLDGQTTLLLQNVLGEQWYSEVAGPVSKTQILAGASEAFPVRHFYEWQIPWVEVDLP